MPAPQGKLPTKEFFAPATVGVESTTNGYLVDHDNDSAIVFVRLPSDFSSFSELKVIIRAVAAVTNMLLQGIFYGGAHGEAYNTHSNGALENLPTVTTTTNYIYEIDMTALTNIANLTAHDVIKFGFYRPVSGNTNAWVIGVNVKYS